MAAEGVDLAILTDESSIAYFAGFWGYLGMEFGRPTFLILRADGAPIVVMPLLECEMVGAMTWVEDVRGWQDAGGRGLEAMLPNGFMTGMIKNIIRKVRIKTPRVQKKENTTLFVGGPGTAFPFISDPPAAMEIVMPRIIMV